MEKVEDAAELFADEFVKCVREHKIKFDGTDEEMRETIIINFHRAVEEQEGFEEMCVDGMKNDE